MQQFDKEKIKQVKAILLGRKRQHEHNLRRREKATAKASSRAPGKPPPPGQQSGNTGKQCSRGKVERPPVLQTTLASNPTRSLESVDRPLKVTSSGRTGKPKRLFKVQSEDLPFPKPELVAVCSNCEQYDEYMKEGTCESIAKQQHEAKAAESQMLVLPTC